ncbi:MAG TPA: GC-type dockerin domain-anchored protein [Phycisphaerales bacterium]|nr:GC-type dockerin domain-anchored protein [Phycisphaerales bacterium]
MSAASPALADTVYHWSNPAGGAWLDVSNWAPAAVPNDAFGTALLGLNVPYTVIRTPSYGELRGLELTNPAVLLRLEGSGNVQNALHIHEGGIVNQGLIEVGSGPLLDVTGAAIFAADPLDISGAGTLRLMGTKSQLKSVGGMLAPINNREGHTIAGAGVVAHVYNRGLIMADVPGTTLEVAGVNAGEIRVKNGGLLWAEMASDPAAHGLYVVEGPYAQLLGHIAHGTLVASSQPAISADLEDIDTTSTFDWSGSVFGTLRNDGSVRLLAVGTLNSARVEGEGSIILASTGAVLKTHGEGVSILGSSHRVAGFGEILGEHSSEGMRLRNDGSIIASIGGKRLGTQDIENRGILGARDGGMLDIKQSSSGTSVDNRGVIRAEASSTIELNGTITHTEGAVVHAAGGTVRCPASVGAVVVGGSIGTDEGGQIVVTGDLALADVVVGGVWDVRGVLTLRAGGTVTSTTSIQSLRPDDGRLRVRLRAGSRLDGPGEVVLRHPSAAIIQTTAPSTAASIGPEQTVRGEGVIGGSGASGTMHIEGTLAPGLPIGVLAIRQAVVLATSARLEMDVTAHEHDVLHVHGPLMLGGTLAVALGDEGLEPCGERPLIRVHTGGSISGHFSTLDLPEMPVGRLGIRYDPDAVILIYNPADYDGSAFVDTDDFTAFITDFESGDLAADINHSGSVDTDDFTDFIMAFEQGC